jgi:restriction system protein
VRGEVRLHRSGINEIDEMLGLDFERYLEWLFRQLGYSVERTAYQGDYGADLVVSRGGMKTAIQAKRSKRNVGNKAIQEVVASAGHYGCQRSMIVTNAFFTKPALRLARDNKVELWDRNRLVTELLKVRTNAQAQVEPSESCQTEPAPRQIEAAVCAGCSSPVSEKVRDYCLDHEKRFAGKVYCYRCQRRPRRAAE